MVPKRKDSEASELHELFSEHQFPYLPNEMIKPAVRWHH